MLVYERSDLPPAFGEKRLYSFVCQEIGTPQGFSCPTVSKHKALNSCCSGPTGAHPQPASSGSSASTKVVDSGGGLSIACSKHGTTYSWCSSSNDLGNQSLKPQSLFLWPSPPGLSLKGTTCFLFHVSESLKQRLYFNFSTLCLKSYELVSYMSSHLNGGCVWSLHHTAG